MREKVKQWLHYYESVDVNDDQRLNNTGEILCRKAMEFVRLSTSKIER